jgi:iron complex outermembrane recepter protein
MNTRILTAVTLLTAALPALSSPQIDEEVVVTSTRSAYAINKGSSRIRVISSGDIAKMAVTSLDELLRNAGSVQVRDTVGNGRSVGLSVRGLAGGQNTLVLVDGRRLNNSDLSDPDLTSVALADVERVEILEGGAGVLFGDQAVGGVVNIITRQSEEASGRIELGGGSYDGLKAEVDYGATALAGALDYRVSAKRERADGYRDETEVNYGTVRGEAGYRYGSGRVFAEMQSTENDFVVPGALLDFQLAMDRRQAGSSFNDYRIDADSYRIGVDHDFADWLKLLVAYGNRQEDVAIKGQSLSFGSSLTSQDRDVTTLDPRLVIDLDDWRFTLGSDLEDYDYGLVVNSAFGLSTSEHEHERRSQYIQGIYAFNDNIQLTAGFRHAEVDVTVDGGYFTADYDDSINVKQLGLNWQISDALRFYVNRDETFRFPVADENVDFLGNVVALSPQEGVAWDLGLAWQWQQIDVDLVLFDHAIENEIGYDTAQFANVNFDDTQRRGFTVDVGADLAPQLALALSYTRMEAEFDEGALSGNRIPAVSEELAKIQLSYSVTDRVQVYAETVYTGPLAVDLYGNAEEISGFAVSNIAATYAIGQLVFKGRINNLFGKQYSEFVSFFGMPAYYPSPEENASLSVVYSF